VGVAIAAGKELIELPLNKSQRQYLKGVNKHWAKDINQYYRTHPEAKSGKFIVINGAAHNANAQGLDNQLNIPSIMFSPDNTVTTSKVLKTNPDKSIDLRKMAATGKLDPVLGHDYVYRYNGKMD
jgi:hypothetical protein